MGAEFGIYFQERLFRPIRGRGAGREGVSGLAGVDEGQPEPLASAITLVVRVASRRSRYYARSSKHARCFCDGSIRHALLSRPFPIEKKNGAMRR